MSTQLHAMTHGIQGLELGYTLMLVAILAGLVSAKPSLVLLRHVNEMTPEQHAALLLANLDALAEDLEAGAVASFARGTIRVRRLPFASE